jgi:hypothetical protein
LTSRFKYQRQRTSGAAGSGLETTASYLQQTTCTAAGNGLGAADTGMGATAKY